MDIECGKPHDELDGREHWLCGYAGALGRLRKNFHSRHEYIFYLRDLLEVLKYYPLSRGQRFGHLACFAYRE